MVFSADSFGAEVAVVVAEDAVVGSVADEQPAINTATHAASPAMRMDTYAASETVIVATTASAMGFACRVEHGYT